MLFYSFLFLSLCYISLTSICLRPKLTSYMIEFSFLLLFRFCFSLSLFIRNFFGSIFSYAYQYCIIFNSLLIPQSFSNPLMENVTQNSSFNLSSNFLRQLPSSLSNIQSISWFHDRCFLLQQQHVQFFLMILLFSFIYHASIFIIPLLSLLIQSIISQCVLPFILLSISLL